MAKTIVIGGGPAGMMAAAKAGSRGNEVLLIEKNEKLGKKLYITGKGRCNVTNAADMPDFFENIPRNPKFLYSALYSFTNSDLIQLLKDNGVDVIIERGNRVFPASQKASDITFALERHLKRANVKIKLNTKAEEILIDDGRVVGVKISGRAEFCDNVIIATGGASYPNTGSTGDGYSFARSAGHEIKEIIPSLSPMETKEQWAKQCQGLSLRNVNLKAFISGKKKFEEQGEMLFTHYGISGPLVLSASCFYEPGKDMSVSIDLKPALSSEQLDARLLREIETAKNKHYINMLGSLMPSKLVPVFANLSGVSPDCPAHQITKSQRQDICRLLKDLKLNVSRLRPIDEAIITRGGVSISQINASTMESKLVRGLFFAGEVLDVDAFTGGFNLQIAFSTGSLAGMSVKDWKENE